MKMKNKLKTTSFWLGVSGAVVVLLEAISDLFGFSVSSSEVESVILSICAILICLGFVTKKTETGKEEKTIDLLSEVTCKDKENKDDL